MVGYRLDCGLSVVGARNCILIDVPSLGRPYPYQGGALRPPRLVARRALQPIRPSVRTTGTTVVALGVAVGALAAG